MANAGEILTTILENFANLIPRRTVHTFQQGIHWRRGKVLRSLPAGSVGWYVPLLDSIDVESTADRVIETETLDLETQDEKPISVRGTGTYAIQDFTTYYVNLQDHAPSILNLMERALAA